MWAAAPGLAGFQGCGYSVKVKSFHVLDALCKYVQERLLEIAVLVSVFPGVRMVHQLESLILAQNERWRHA